MSKFKVGDRVEMVVTDSKAVKGLKGTIRGISSQPDARNYGVEFDNDMGGHDLHSCVRSCPSCKDGHGWWVRESSIKLLPAKFEVGQIYRVGKLSAQHQYENGIIKLSETRPFGFEVKAIRGEAPHDFGEHSEYARSLTLLTGPQIGEAIRKYDADRAEKKTGVKEIKRRAKVGEYIKIVKAFCAFGYENGDILLVTRIRDGNSVICKDAKICVCNSEYVVLEGYKPGRKEERRKAKVGDTIKILSDNGGRVHAGTIWKVKSVHSNGDLSIVNDAIGGGYMWSCAADNYIVLSSEKHSYTAEQVAEAKKLCGEMMVEAFDDGNTFSLQFVDKNYSKDSEEVSCKLACFNGAPDSSGTATCSDHDEYNVWIGRCVALCKALHKPIPAFIMGDGAARHFSLEKAKRLAYDVPHHEIGIHCKSPDETNRLMRALEELGYRWVCGEKPTEFDSPDEFRFINDVSKTLVKDTSPCGQPCAEFSDCFTED